MRLTAFTCLAVAAACTETSEGPDLTGLWRVTSHTENTTGCTPGAAVTDPPYIQFSRETLFGQEYFQWAPCSAPGTCETTSLFDLSYAKAIPGGYEAQIYVASGDATACSLGATVSTAIVADDGSLTIETRINTKDSITGTACTTDEAKAALDAGQLACAGLEVMTAVRN